MAQTRRSTARGLEQVPSRRLSAVPAEEAASELQGAANGAGASNIEFSLWVSA